MNKYIYILLLFSFLSSLQMIAQTSFQQSYGITYISAHSQQQSFTLKLQDRPAYDVLTPKYYSDFMTLSYYPRVNIKNWAASGLSIGAPIAISAFAEVSTSRSIFQEKKNYLLLSLPIVAEWAWGYRAQRDRISKALGFYAHAGGALTLGRGTVGEFSNINPYVGGGIRIKMSEKLGLELAYGQNFISVLKANSDEVDYGSIPPFREDFGIAKLDAKDKRATKTFQIALSFH